MNETPLKKKAHFHTGKTCMHALCEADSPDDGSQGFIDGGSQCTRLGKPERKGISIESFHFHVTQIKRSAGQSAVASTAYRSGEKLHSEYYAEDSDYTQKGGVF